MPQHRQYLPCRQSLQRRQILPRRQDFPRRAPVCLGKPDPTSRTPESSQHGSHWLSADFLNVIPHVYQKRAGIPKLEGGCHSSLGSSGDISISHSGVSCGHRNVPHTSISHYMTSPDSSGHISISHSGVSCGHRNVPHASISHSMTSPDSSGLHRPPSRTLLHYNGSFPSRPTPRSESSLRRSCTPSGYIYLFTAALHTTT